MFVVYSKPNCSSCDQAKSLLANKGLQYQERIVDVGQPKDADKIYCTVQQLREVVPDARTVPQILQGEKLIGGFDQLKELLL